MSRPGADDEEQEQEQDLEEEEEEEEEEQSQVEEDDCFHDSLDRILSSSNSSTSASEEDDVVFNSPRHARRYRYSLAASAVKASPKLPISSQNYDVWVSDAAFSSSSLQQRRDRLLRALGLSSDPTLSRRSPSLTEYDAFDLSRSATSTHLAIADTRSSRIHPGSPIPRSKSEGSGQTSDQPAPSTTILSIHSASGDTVNSDATGNKSNKVNFIDDHVQDGVGVVDNLAVLSKPPSGRRNLDNEESQRDSGTIPAEDVSAQMCTIKNLDTGKEFVVNEVREDGMWNKVREVGTGRQLTIEEFEMCVGNSPIVQELMRRHNVEEQAKDNMDANASGNGENGAKSKKKVSWFKTIKNVASSVTGHKERRGSDERDTSSEKGGRRSSSATDDSQDVTFHGPERVRVRQYGKSVKELSGLYKSQEIQAHNGSIWSMKFSLDGRYLASAGEDCVIHVWEVVKSERKGELLMERPDDSSLSLLHLTNGSPEPNSFSPILGSPLERKRRGRSSFSRKSMSLDHIVVPDTVFGLSEKPVCSFQGHLDDVLDLSWSKSQLLLSSSMDKTVRLWDLSSKICLKTFSHSDYVTCIQFNPVDDRYFISGSLDAKVRIWSIPEGQVVDWNDMHEMVTAACYTPDGQGALVGSYKGSCRVYNTSENKLQQKSHINLQNKKKKSHLKKITGFQFTPGSSSEVLITSADSRVRVVDGVDLIHKFKGFHNTNSQISASITKNGKYVVCASKDSHVYIWKHETGSRPGRSKGLTTTRSYEHFHCPDISVSIPWPGLVSDSSLPCSRDEPDTTSHDTADEIPTSNHPPTPVRESCSSGSSPLRGTISGATNGYFFDRMRTTWPEEKLILATKNQSPRHSLDFSNGVIHNRSAWSMVIVTAGIRGEIRTFQNFGLPVRI
ncbi:hypothetical protein V2J09_007379 [Rumex salicifolius]